MSKGREQTEKITKYRKPININLGLVIFSVLFIYIVVIIISYFRSEQITPYEVSLGSLAVNNTYEGIVLREETVVESPYSGYINYYARESEKVNHGAMIFTVDSTGKLSDLIKDSEGTGTLSDEDMSEIRTDISEFGSSFDPHNFRATYDFKYSIEGIALKLANYKMLSNIENIFSTSYTDSIDFGYAPCAGILVYSTDGYEGLKPEDMTSERFASYLDTAGIPDPDLMIRTSGEHRLSNFLTWQLAYSELYFTPVPWPDFNREELQKAVDAYADRDRRFGGLSEEE